MGLSGAIDNAVKAYLDHTNMVIAGNRVLDVSYLMQPFQQAAITAQQILTGTAQLQNGAEAPNGEEVTGKGKRKKRAYKQRDPNAPKRPQTAYFLYLHEQRPLLATELAAKAGGVPQRPGDLSKEATLRWNQLRDEEKQVYRDQYQVALTSYNRAAKKYKEETGQLPPDDNPEGDESMLDGIEDAAAAGADADGDDAESSSEDDDEVEDAQPPPKLPTPEPVKKSKKNKASAAAVAVPIAPKPHFSSLNVPGSDKSNTKSPERKRKASDHGEVAEDAVPKKRGRKSNATKAAEAEAVVADTPAAAVAPMATPAVKSEKKKKRKSEAAATA